MRRARRILRDEEDARDASQEIFLRALRGEMPVPDAVAPTTWLYRVTTNYCLNWKRDQARRGDLLAEYLPADESFTSGEPDDRATVLELLERLPASLVEIAGYYYFEGLEQHEIAARLGLSRRTVGNRLESFRLAARALLLDGDLSPP